MLIRRAEKTDFPKLVQLYQTCFAEPPWFETFDQNELIAEFSEFDSWPDAVFLVCEIDGEVAGASTGFSVIRKSDVCELVSPEFKKEFYFADVFVDPRFRKRGIARALICARREWALAFGFTHGVVRTSVQQPIVKHMYLDKLGYKIVAMQETFSTKVINGVSKEAPDTRVIMAGRLIAVSKTYPENMHRTTEHGY